jgi:hypothetical protein
MLASTKTLIIDPTQTERSNSHTKHQTSHKARRISTMIKLWSIDPTETQVTATQNIKLAQGKKNINDDQTMVHKLGSVLVLLARSGN